MRRACLDLTGRLPTPSQTDDYLKLDSEVRRTWLVDSLLSSDEFNRYWTQKLAKLFRLRKLPNSQAAMEAYHRWLGQQLEEHAGYDSIVKGLLLARGDTTEVGPANFYRTADNPRERAELVSEVFMASRLRCANCHNHPLDQWTQDDYHGLAAILATIRVSEKSVVDQPAAKVTHPKQDAMRCRSYRLELGYREKWMQTQAWPRNLWIGWLRKRTLCLLRQSLIVYGKS